MRNVCRDGVYFRPDFRLNGNRVRGQRFHSMEEASEQADKIRQVLDSLPSDIVDPQSYVDNALGINRRKRGTKSLQYEQRTGDSDESTSEINNLHNCIDATLVEDLHAVVASELNSDTKIRLVARLTRRS